METPSRKYNADGQRYLYHGMEQELEVSGNVTIFQGGYTYSPINDGKSYINSYSFGLTLQGSSKFLGGGEGEPKKYEVKSDNPWTVADEKKLPTQDVEIGEQIIIKHKPGEKGYKEGDRTTTIYTYKGNGKYSYESRYYKSGSLKGEISLGNKNTLAVFDSYMNFDQEGINIGGSANDIAQTKPVQVQKPKEQNTVKQDASSEPVKKSSEVNVNKNNHPGDLHNISVSTGTAVTTTEIIRNAKSVEQTGKALPVVGVVASTAEFFTGDMDTRAQITYTADIAMTFVSVACPVCGTVYFISRIFW